MRSSTPDKRTTSRSVGGVAPAPRRGLVREHTPSRSSFVDRFRSMHVSEGQPKVGGSGGTMLRYRLAKAAASASEGVRVAGIVQRVHHAHQQVQIERG